MVEQDSVETNADSFGASTFDRDFGLLEPTAVRAVGILSDPARLANKIVLRPGQELPDPLEKIARGESDVLPGFPAF
jgi:hypothetical protein